MNEIVRFGIYMLPQPGPLADFGASWLGWDVATGSERDHPVLDDDDLDLAQITATPRKYGFHGTIKPPFHLAAGQSPEALQETLCAVCATAAPVEMDGLALSRIGRFLALTPTGDTSGLAGLAARAVRDLDHFRAPPSEAELARRRTRALKPSQEANLVAWGYPYVMDDFQFHLTLTGSIDTAPERTRCFAALERLVAPILPRPFRVDSLCLVGSDASGRFRLLTRCPLGTG